MPITPVISWLNIEPSGVVMTLVDRRVAALERLYDRLTGCEIALEAPQKQDLHARIYTVRLAVRVPGLDFHTRQSVAWGSAHTNLVLAVDRAFSAAEKHLRRHKKKTGRIAPKHCDPKAHGVVTEIGPAFGHGALRADGGREV